MAVVQTKSNTNNGRTFGATDREPSEFDGFWLNIGPMIETTDEDGVSGTKMVRLPRGVAVSDLKTRKLYDGTSPEYASEVELSNSIIELIQEQCKELAEGESIPIKLEVQLYRRQEAVEVKADKTSKEAIKQGLFG